MKKLFGILFLFITITANSTIYYVNQNGSANFKTIQSCVNILKPGDICIVSKGVYDEFVILPKNITKKSTNPITIYCQTPKTVIVKGFYIQSNNVPLIIKGFVIVSQGVYVNSPDVQLIDNTFIEVKDTAIKVNINADNALIVSNKILRCQSGIKIEADNCIVSNNQISQIVDFNKQNLSYCINIKGNKGNYSSNYLSDNKLEDVKRSAIIGFLVESGNDNVIEKNIVGDYQYGVLCSSNILYGINNLIIKNNIFVGNLDDNIESYFGLYAFGTNKLNVVNNLFAYDNFDGIKAKYDISTIIQDNIFYYSKGYGIDNGIATNNLLFSDIQFDQNQFPDDIVNKDPLFIGNNNFHLQINSPCINSGTITNATDDFEGTLRPLDSLYDIGPYETTIVSKTEIRDIELLLNDNIDFTQQLRMINFKRLMAKICFEKALKSDNVNYKKNMYKKTIENLEQANVKIDEIISSLNNAKSKYQTDINIIKRIIYR